MNKSSNDSNDSSFFRRESYLVESPIYRMRTFDVFEAYRTFDALLGPKMLVRENMDTMRSRVISVCQYPLAIGDEVPSTHIVDPAETLLRPC